MPGVLFVVVTILMCRVKKNRDLHIDIVLVVNALFLYFFLCIFIMNKCLIQCVFFSPLIYYVKWFMSAELVTGCHYSLDRNDEGVVTLASRCWCLAWTRKIFSIWNQIANVQLIDHKQRIELLKFDPWNGNVCKDCREICLS